MTVFTRCLAFPRQIPFMFVLAAGLVPGLSCPASADPIGSITGSLPNLSVPQLNLGTTVQGVTSAVPTTGLAASASSIGSGPTVSGAFFLPNDGVNSAFRDPNTPTYLPVKAGMALFTTNAGKFRIDFQYAGRFNGDFEEHQAALKFRVKLPSF